MPAELPFTRQLTEIPAEIARIQARIRAGERLLRAVRRMHAEWPTDARRRVVIVQDWQRGGTPATR